MPNKITILFINRILASWPDEETKHQVKSRLEESNLNVQEAIEYLSFMDDLVDNRTLN